MTDDYNHYIAIKGTDGEWTCYVCAQDIQQRLLKTFPVKGAVRTLTPTERRKMKIQVDARRWTKRIMKYKEKEDRFDATLWRREAD